MLKRIETSQLRVGMFIESLEGSWLNTPLAGRRFLLESETDARTLKHSNVSGVFINTAKGLDASPHPAPPARAPRTSYAATEKQKAAIAKILNEATALLKGIFDDAQAGGDVTVAAVAPIITQIASSTEHNADILLSMTRLKSKDETTFLHSIAVSALMIRFGRYLKLDKETVSALGMAGLLHDIGKLAVPGDVLQKESTLTESEMTLMRMHPVQGHSMLARQADMPAIVLDVCLHHHERMDGRGYPYGLVGEAISVPARMAAICDVYDAITSARPYKKAWTTGEAIAWMLERKGYFDRPLLLQFLNGVLQS